MGTQATLALVRDGKVVRKIVAGCNGINMPSLRGFLETSPTDDPDELLKACRDHHVGCADCLVLQIDKHTARGLDESDEATAARFVDHFDDPIFNPRWEHGTAAYSLVLHLDKICKSQPRRQNK